MSKEIIKKPASEVSKWFAKETIGNFIYDQLNLLWRSALMTGVVAFCIRLFSGIPLDVWLIVALFIAALAVFVLDRVARRRGWVTALSEGTSSKPREAVVDEVSKAAVAGYRDEVVENIQGCKDQWLHERLKTDKATIRDLIWVASIFYRTAFDKSQPRIDFVFTVFNISLIDVEISMDGGYVLFSDDNERFHFDPKVTTPNPALCRSRGSTNFVIQQAVTGDEITNNFKSTDNTRISFGNLRVSFRGTEQFSQITPTTLDVNHYLFTAERAWHNPNRPKFPEQECKLPHVQAVPPKLSFEIDGKQSQVNTLGGGTAGRRIHASIRLRCVKIAEHRMAIREFHAALLKEGQSEPIVPQEGALIVMNHPDMKTVDFADGWTVSEPLTGYRWFMFYLDITEQQLQKLSRDYYMRVTMVAVGQQPFSVDFDVNNWQDARTSNSYITVRGNAEN